MTVPSFLENLKFLGQKRSMMARQAKLNRIARSAFRRAGTPPRVKTGRRYRKQADMGLSVLRKEVVAHGLARSPTKVRQTFPAKKVPHPGEMSRKEGKPYYKVDRS